MAGQVDIIISKQAMAEITTATEKLETLRLKVLEVNKAGAKTTGVSNNDDIVQEIQKTNALIAAQKNLISVKRKTTKALHGTAQALADEINQLKKEQNTLTTSNKSWLQYEMRIMKVQGKLKSLTATQSQISVATRKSAQSTKSFAGSLGGLGNILKGGGILFALMKLKDLAVSLVTNFFGLAKTFDSLRFALERTSKTVQEGAMNMRFMLEISSNLGLSLVATTTRFIKFAAAARNSGMAMRDTQKIFETMAKAGAVLGLRTDELSGVFLALEQMLSKGKVTTEELRRQLGERLPGAFGIMAASLGVTLPKLDEMLKKGEILSADVLPGFAEAVEVAFGLETVTKVETLVAVQNRLTTAWQNFVRKITEDGGTISNAFKSILNIARESLSEWDKMINKSANAISDAASQGYKGQEDFMKKNASDLLEDTKKQGEKLADLDKAIFDAKSKLRSKLNSDEANKELAKAVQAKLKYNKELGFLEQKEGEKEFATRFAAVMEQEKLLELAKNELQNLNTQNKNLEGNDILSKFISPDKLEKEIKNIEELLARNQGRLDATRLFGEKSKSAVLDPKDIEKTLSKISDLTNPAIVAELLKDIEFQKEKIKIAKNGSDEMLELIQSNIEKEITVEGLLAKDKIKVAEKQAKDLVKDAKIKISNKKELAKRLKEIQKNLDDKTFIIQQNQQKKVGAITKSYFSIQEKQTKNFFKLKANEIKGDAANELTNLRDVYLKELETTKDKKALYKKYLSDKNKQEVESFNLIIDLRIEEQKALALLNEGNNKYVEGLEARINILKGRKKVDVVPGATSEIDKEKEKYKLLLGYASDYANAITDIASGIFDGKIQEIDAEIEATRLKYDEMYILAEGDAKQTKLLRIQEAEDLAKLEKKKRKIQRQKAIFEKANALIQIAINTAVAVSRAPADLGPLGLALIPIIVGLGALQSAAVLAQPLPKFAKGGVMSHDGLAVVGDGGKQEVIRTPDGKVSLTPSTDTVVNLQKGTEIFSSVDKFNQQNPNEMTNMLHSASLLASISLNQKNINGMMSGQKQLDERLLDAMLLNTKAVKKSQSNTYVKTQKIDIAHELWKSNLLN